MCGNCVLQWSIISPKARAQRSVECWWNLRVLVYTMRFVKCATRLIAFQRWRWFPPRQTVNWCALASSSPEKKRTYCDGARHQGVWRVARRLGGSAARRNWYIIKCSYQQLPANSVQFAQNQNAVVLSCMCGLDNDHARVL